MREYVLTEQETAIIKKYLENGEKLEGFKMLLSRCKSIETVNADLELIKQFISKVEEQKP
jgi:5-bromo-4-chloroindolyl phosphate hydrolysis protein